MKKFKKNIGTVMSAIGMAIAIGTADGSKYELFLRLLGVVLFGLGAYLAEMMDFQQTEE